MNKQQLIEHIMGLAEQWAEYFAWGNSAEKQEAALREFLTTHLSEAILEQSVKCRHCGFMRTNIDANDGAFYPLKPAFETVQMPKEAAIALRKKARSLYLKDEDD